MIRVPASPGRESAPTLVLQGHLDMVCEREPSSPNDPAEGRIALVRDGDWLKADGTTLGADDGVAIAAMMALVEDDSIEHGPLELLMTVAEEVGLEGANALDGSLLTGSTLINLDSEEDGVLTVGCAGSTDTWIRVDAPRELLRAECAHLHAHRERRARRPLREPDPPRSRERDQGARAGAARGPRRSTVPARVAERRQEPQRHPPGCRGGLLRSRRPGRRLPYGCRVGARDGSRRLCQDRPRRHRDHRDRRCEAADAWTEEATATLLDVVALVPTGPLAMSPDFEGLVETSTSLGEASTEGGQLTLHSLSRSSNDSALPEVVATLDAAARLAGGALEVKHNYKGWRPDLDSPVLAVARTAYERLFGEPPRVSAVHAGLETAVIGTKVSGPLDMLALGPQLESPHSPDERVSIPTVERFWRLLVAVVDGFSTPRS